MKTDRPREIALKILNGQGPQQETDLEVLFTRNGLDQRDRAFVSNMVQGVHRWRLRLDWVIGQFSSVPLKRIDGEILNILRIALYQIFFMDRVPESAAVNEAVNIIKAAKRPRHIVSFVNGVLRTICRQRGEIRFPDRDSERLKHLSVFYSYPEWLRDKWIKELGADLTEALFKSQNTFPEINIRANTLRIDRDTLIELLAQADVDASPLPWSPEGILLKGFRGSVAGLDAFKSGLFQVQDQAAQAATRLLSVKEGDRVLDICAGLGGKSSHLCELMGGRGQVIALDNNRERLAGLTRNAGRLGIGGCIHPVLADASGPLSALFREGFGKAVLDAPCSGLGVISRHPDIKWNRKAEDIQRLAAIQRALIGAAVPVLEKGGELLYIVCTISREENEGLVEDVLARHRGLSLVNLKERAPSWCQDLINDEGFFRTWPHIHGMDGFFAALFRKNCF